MAVVLDMDSKIVAVDAMLAEDADIEVMDAVVGVVDVTFTPDRC